MTSENLTPVDANFVWVLRTRAATSALLLFLAVVALDATALRETNVPLGLVSGLVALLGLAFVAWLPRRRWRAWAYREGEDELDIRHGRLVRVRTVVPYARVQHIDVSEGPVERRFGLATLILHTAGTRAASVGLPGLPRDEADRLRDRIRLKIRQEIA